MRTGLQDGELGEGLILVGGAIWPLQKLAEGFDSISEMQNACAGSLTYCSWSKGIRMIAYNNRYPNLFIS